jgi:hypothetical protein
MRLQICRSARAGSVRAIKAAAEIRVMLIRDVMRIARDYYHDFDGSMFPLFRLMF